MEDFSFEVTIEGVAYSLPAENTIENYRGDTIKLYGGCSIDCDPLSRYYAARNITKQQSCCNGQLMTIRSSYDRDITPEEDFVLAFIQLIPSSELGGITPVCFGVNLSCFETSSLKDAQYYEKNGFEFVSHPFNVCESVRYFNEGNGIMVRLEFNFCMK